MKKKIAVVFTRMIVGGAEKACINFLKAIDKSRYEVYLFTHVNGNPYIDKLPEQIILCDLDMVNPQQQLVHKLKRGRFLQVILGIYHRAMCRFVIGGYSKLMHSQKAYLFSETDFDCAISYTANYPNTAATLYSVNSEKKITFVHGDLSDEQKTIAEFYPHLCKFSHIFCVSEATNRRTKKLYQSLSSKMSVMYNAVDYQEILLRAEEGICQFNKTAIVTVGRLSSEKGQQMVPQTVRILLDQGYDINWYLVGDGPLHGEVERECEKHNVQDHVILLGTKINPYPYIKNCDIYVQPSFTEGYCTTTVEAKVLCKPIVTTDAPGMREQFVSGENGLIVDAMTPEALAEGIRQLLDHPEMCEKFTNALKNESFDNAKEMQKLYDFIES